MIKTRPSEHCFYNCKPVELKLQETLKLPSKTPLIKLIHVKLLRMKENYNNICLKR